MSDPASRMRSIRRQRGFSLDTLARITGLAVCTVYRTETARTDPSQRTRELIAEALEVHPDDLFPELTTA
jgi:transcriptional regulator with XRE-family HTH domain